MNSNHLLYTTTLFICLITIDISAKNNYNKADVEGVWLMANQNVKVKMYQTPDSLYEGRVIWMDTDANFKNFNVNGIIVDKLIYDFDKAIYEGGNFYGRGYRLNCSVRLLNKDTLEVIVSKGILHKTKYCTRIKQ